MSTIQMDARYPGRCNTCGTRFAAGTAITFNKNTRQAAHLHCPAAPATMAEAVARAFTSGEEGTPFARGSLVIAYKGRKLPLDVTGVVLAVRDFEVTHAHRRNYYNPPVNTCALVLLANGTKTWTNVNNLRHSNPDFETKADLYVVWETNRQEWRASRQTHTHNPHPETP